VESLVAGAIGEQSAGRVASPADIRDQIDRVTIDRSEIHIQLSEAAEAGARSLTVPWTPPSPYRKREIIRSLARRWGSSEPNSSK
jgi:hypothetical protein